jgi:SAM-dependent methyltransferase
VPDDAFLRVLYDEVIDPPKASFESQSPGWVAHQLRLAALILERFTDAREVHLLDYGCGYGTLVRTLNGPRVHCKGYEPSPSVVTRVREAGLDVTASLAEVEETAPFDGIILSDVLEHVPEPRAVLAKCRSLLKPGGWLVANVPDFAERRASAILDDLRRGLPAPPDLNPWEHLNYYTPASLARIVESAGFRVDPAANADFGFRPGERGRRAWLNAVKSALRVVRFLRRPQATTTTILASRT